MAKTLEEIREQLSAIEPSEETYDDLGPDDVDALKELASDDQDWLAARAVHALARVGSGPATDAVVAAASDSRREVRAAAAMVARLMPAESADAVVARLVDDSDPSVRKFAVQSVTSGSGDAVLARVTEVAHNDDDPRIRRLAQGAVDSAQA